MPDPLIILSATAYEQQLLRDSLQQATTQRRGHRAWVRGMIGIRPVVLIETGIGAVNTAQALTVALQEIDPELVLQIGIGGAYLGSGLDKGDFALANEENYGDLGVVAPDGWFPADEIGIPVLSAGRDYYNTYPLDSKLVDNAQHILEQSGECVVQGPFVTVQQCTGREDIGNELAARFNAICENMEGAAAAHVCMLYAAPFLELRAISNRVEDRNKDAWDIPRAVQRVQIAARKFIEAL